MWHFFERLVEFAKICKITGYFLVAMKSNSSSLNPHSPSLPYILLSPKKQPNLTSF